MSKTVTLQVKEMTQADVKFISLVKRSASRIPFRVLKTAEESNMGINLNGLFSRTKKAAEIVSPAVAGIVVPASTNIDDAVAKVEELGLKVIKTDTESNEDAVILVVKEDYNPETTHTIKMSDDVAVLVETAEKSFYGWPEGTSFSENMSQAGFFPGLRIASNTLVETIENQLYGSDALPAEEISKSLDEYKTYVLSLASNIPETAFKMQGLEVVAKEDAKVEVEVTETVNTESSDEATPVEKQDADAAPTEEVVEKDDNLVPVDELKKAELDLLRNDLLAAIKVTVDKMDSLGVQVEKAITTSEEAMSLAKKADEALGGVVVGDDNSIDNPEPVVKAQSSGIFDTAFKFEGYTD